MDVTIIGSGKMGRGLATRFLSGGHNVTLLDRQPDKARSVAQEVASSARKGAKAQGAVLNGAVQGEIVVLAVPYSAMDEVVEKNGAGLADKIVVDITNPLNASYDGLVVPADSSAAEEIARELPAGARVIKAFNTTFASTLESGKVDGQPLDIFIAGDDSAAKDKLSQLNEDGGRQAIDRGPLKRAGQLEGLCLVGITIEGRLGHGFRGAGKILA